MNCWFVFEIVFMTRIDLESVSCGFLRASLSVVSLIYLIHGVQNECLNCEE